VLGQGGNILGAALPSIKFWDPSEQVERMPPPEHVHVMSPPRIHCPFSGVRDTEAGVPDDLQPLHPVSCMLPAERIIIKANLCAIHALFNLLIIIFFQDNPAFSKNYILTLPFSISRLIVSV